VAVRSRPVFSSALKGARLPQNAVRDGSRTLSWPAALRNQPCVFLDGAHNEHSLRTVVAEVARHAGCPVILFACAKIRTPARCCASWRMPA